MKWLVYASKEMRQAKPAEGIELEGQYVSAAPSPGTVWAVTPGGATHLVRRGRQGKPDYEIDEACYKSRGASRE